MRINDVLLESTIKNDPIFEDIYRGSKLLAELKLSNDQITKIFQAVADSAAKGENDGSNRTVLGKGADAVTSVSQAFDKVKDKISKSGPVSGFDAAFDKMQTQILDAAGGDAGAVGKAIDSYREFAKKHPIMQGAIYGGLIALAGISGAGLGGAALLGGIKLFDRLLQGDKASSALWKGFKTGALAYAAGQVGNSMQGEPEVPAPDDVKLPGSDATKSSNDIKLPAADAASDAAAVANSADITNPQLQAAIKAVQSDPSNSAEYKKAFIDALKDEVKNYGTKDPDNIRASIDFAKDAAVRATESVEYIDRKHTVWTWALNESLNRAHGGVMLTTAGVAKIFESIVNEGPFTDKIKSAAGKVAGAVGGAVKRGWEDASNKVTYNKLDLNWRRGEGRDQTGPVDSEVLAGFLRKQGVVDGLISNVYKSMKIPFKPAAAQQTNTSTSTSNQQPRSQRTSTQSAAPAGNQSTSGTSSSSSAQGFTASASLYSQVKDGVTRLDKKGKQRIQAYLQKLLPQSTPTIKPAAKKKPVAKKPQE